MTNAPTDELTPPPPVDVDEPIKHGRERWVKYFERQYLSKLLEAHRGNVTAAAKAAGIDRGHFYRLLFRCGLRGGDANGSRPNTQQGTVS